MRASPALALLLALAMLPAAADARFVVRDPIVKTAAGRKEAREMMEIGFLQEVAVALNNLFVLPGDVGLRYAECGEANAYYDSSEQHILMCLELMEGMAETIKDQYEDEDSAAEAIAGAYIAVALHEAGHALVDVLEIPVTGREEDAVDQLSAWMLIRSDDVDSVLGAAASYYTEDDVGDDDFADEHSLNRQRYFNLLCWAYGSDPENSEELIDVWLLPKGRAEGCEQEYAQLDRSWSRLLDDHLRPGDGSTVDVPRDRPASQPGDAPQGDGDVGDDGKVSNPGNITTRIYTAPRPSSSSPEPRDLPIGRRGGG